MYAHGKGIPQNYRMAHMLFNLAATNGDEEAKNNRGVIAGRMTKDDIAEAQKMAREWLEKYPSQ